MLMECQNIEAHYSPSISGRVSRIAARNALALSMTNRYWRSVGRPCSRRRVSKRLTRGRLSCSLGHNIVRFRHGGRLLSESCRANRILSNRRPPPPTNLQLNSGHAQFTLSTGKPRSLVAQLPPFEVAALRPFLMERPQDLKSESCATWSRAHRVRRREIPLVSKARRPSSRRRG